ncbi:glycosyltransferase family 4 protein, partial [Streptomyces oryzae]
GPLVLSVSRLVRRKGQDTLLRAMPLVRAAVPGAGLLIVGSGPCEGALRRLVRRLPGLPEGAVVFAGSQAHGELPPYYAAADVFAMPCRTRRLGLEAEGLGIVYLEAAAAGLPVLVGESGGAPEAVRDGETGHVVDGSDVHAVADRLIRLLGSPRTAAAMGAEGRAWVEAEWSWDATARRLRSLLSHTVEAW